MQTAIELPHGVRRCLCSWRCALLAVRASAKRDKCVPTACALLARALLTSYPSYSRPPAVHVDTRVMCAYTGRNRNVSLIMCVIGACTCTIVRSLFVGHSSSVGHTSATLCPTCQLLNGWSQNETERCKQGLSVTEGLVAKRNRTL